MGSFGGILISIIVDYICKHFEIESLMNIGWVLYKGIIAEIAAF